MERELNLTENGLLIYDLDKLAPGGQGQILEFTLRLGGVCPERRVAVAVAVTERDCQNREHPRGIRTAVVPPHHGEGPRDLAIQPFRFILPGDLDLGGGGPRRLTVRADAHYIDQGGCCILPGPGA